LLDPERRQKVLEYVAQVRASLERLEADAIARVTGSEVPAADGGATLQADPRNAVEGDELGTKPSEELHQLQQSSALAQPLLQSVVPEQLEQPQQLAQPLLQSVVPEQLEHGMGVSQGSISAELSGAVSEEQPLQRAEQPQQSMLPSQPPVEATAPAEAAQAQPQLGAEAEAEGYYPYPDEEAEGMSMSWSAMAGGYSQGEGFGGSDDSDLGCMAAAAVGGFPAEEPPQETASEHAFGYSGDLEQDQGEPPSSGGMDMDGGLAGTEQPQREAMDVWDDTLREDSDGTLLETQHGDVFDLTEESIDWKTGSEGCQRKRKFVLLKPSAKALAMGRGMSSSQSRSSNVGDTPPPIPKKMPKAAPKKAKAKTPEETKASSVSSSWFEAPWRRPKKPF
jgi:hypothetical protein